MTRRRRGCCAPNAATTAKSPVKYTESFSSVLFPEVGHDVPGPSLYLAAVRLDKAELPKGGASAKGEKHGKRGDKK